MRCWSSWPGLRERAGELLVGVADHPAEDLGRGDDRSERRDTAGGPAHVLGQLRRRRRSPTAVVASIGPIRCDPQRSCSRARGSSCSYVPIEMCSAPWYAARSLLRRARTAGVSASRLDTSSWAIGLRREPRTTRTAVAVANMPGEHARLLERQLRLGQVLLDRGQHRHRLGKRAGPRRSGLSILFATSHFGRAATFSVPSGRRTAHAQAVGPCTSTPLRSAIPPRRSFSAIALRVAPLREAPSGALRRPRRAEPARRRARRSASARAPTTR